MGKGDDFWPVGCVQIIECGKCGRHYPSDGKKENLINSGWKKKWSWRAFRFIYICPICVVEKELSMV